MTQLRHEADTDVVQAIDDAARAACDVLDQVFPGGDGGGITSNFQGLLVEVLGHMLKGRSVLDGRRGHSTDLPQLVADDAFFGSPYIRGEAFLLTKEGHEMWDHRTTPPKYLGRETLVLPPGRHSFCSLAQAGDAWTSFEAAAAGAREYLKEIDASFEQARDLGLKIQPVVLDRSRETGYLLAEHVLPKAA